MVRCSEICNLASIQQNGVLTFEVPGLNCYFNGKASRVEYYDTLNYKWNASVESLDTCLCNDGSMTIVSNKGRVSGVIYADDESFHLFPIKQNLSTLAKMDTLKTHFECGFESDTSSSPPLTTILNNQLEQDVSYRNNQCYIDVFIFYTVEASPGGSEPMNVEELAEFYIEYTNEALRRSNIGSNEITLNLVGIEQADTLSEAGFSSLRDLENAFFELLANDSTSFIAKKVDTTGADIAVLLASRGISGESGLAAGGVTVFPPQDTFYYSIGHSAIKAFSNRSETVFAHELGHNFGCEHQRCSVFGHDCSNASFPGFHHAHGWEGNRCLRTSKYATLVQSPKRGTNRNVTIQADVTGQNQEPVEETADNVRMIKDHGCILANVNSRDDEFLFASIDGPVEGCPNSSVVFSVSTDGTTGPFNYEWRTSSDGFNYGSILSTTSNLTVSLPGNEGDKVFIKVEVSTTTGLNSTAFFDITVIDDEELCFRSTPEEDISSQPKNITLGDPVPNPMNNSSIVRIGVPSPSNIRLEILDNNGRKIKLLQEGLLDMGSYDFEIKLGDYPSGVYILRLIANNDIISKKIILLK